jgi:uncharacterized protein (TIGR03083 family)
VTSDPQPWIAALRSSHDRLAGLVASLDAEGVRGPSYDPGWPIAQVLSHLGSQAEIFELFLDTALTGAELPAPDRFPAIWAVWDGKDPDDQVHDALAADRAFLERIEGLTEDQRRSARLSLFGTERDLVGLLQMRLAEHSLHTWDVAVALDDTALLSPDAVVLLVDALGDIVARTGKPEALPGPVGVRTTDPERRLQLTPSDGALRLDTENPGTPPSELPAEALVRLVYGRLDPSHTPKTDVDADVLDALRAAFPGP